MADERIDVQVTDSVDGNVAKKFNQIADGAERAESYVKRLKSALSSVNTSSLDRLASAMAKMDSAQAKLLNSQARLTNAQNQGSVAAQKAALAEQKLATEAARTEAAQQRAAAATIGAEAAAMRLVAAQNRLAGSSNAAASALTESGAAAGAAGTNYSNAAGGATRFANAANGAAGAGTRMGVAAQNVANGYGNTVNAANQYARAARQTTAVNANIIAQMQDIGVSLAGGQNPLLVMIQQGSQLSYIASTMQGGWTAMLGVIARLMLRLAPLAAIIGVVTLAIKDMRDEADKGMDKYIQSLGLTEKEVEKLKNTHVTMGDVIKAAWIEISSDILKATGFTADEVQSYWNKALSLVGQAFKAVAVIIYAITAALVQSIARDVMNIPKYFYNAGVLAKQLFLKSIEFLVNKTIEGINAIGDTINMLSNAAGFGDVVGHMKSIQIASGNMGDGLMEIDHGNFLDDLGKNAVAADKYLTDLGGRITDTARKLREADLAEQARKIKRDRPDGPKGREDHTAENRAHALDMVNLKLDDELKRMKLLKDERAIQQRMDQIEESLAQKKIKLNEAERKTIEDKVRAIEMYKYQQAEMDRIYEEAVGPARTYQAALAAITDLEGRGAITAARAAQERTKANRTFQEATDPLFQLKEGLTTAEAALYKYGDAAKQAAFYEQIRQAYLAKGITLSPQYVAGINAEVDALMRRNQALITNQQISDQVAQLVNPGLQDQLMLENKQKYYDELERLRQSDLQHEHVYQQARWALDQKFNQAKLQGLSDMFGQIATLQSSGNKKLAAIGKAAAVAQATIQGIQAVQNALATPAPWPLPLVFAGVAATMAGLNVARIISTPVGNYATGGQFMVGGKDGVDANNINMNVTKGERITVETARQQRENDAANQNNSPTLVNQNNVKVTFDPRNMLDTLPTAEGDATFNIMVERNADEIRRVLG